MPVGEAFKGFRAPLRWPWGQGLFGVEPVSERGGERRSEGEPSRGRPAQREAIPTWQYANQRLL